MFPLFWQHSSWLSWEEVESRSQLVANKLETESKDLS
jgi:hypothetical protein